MKWLPYLGVFDCMGRTGRSGECTRRSQKVLILSGSGGVGNVAVQIAKARGGKVFVAASVAKHDIVPQLGAVPLDYPSTSIEEIVQTFTDGHGFDVVYDTVGGSTLDNAFQGC